MNSRNTARVLSAPLAAFSAAVFLSACGLEFSTDGFGDSVADSAGEVGDSGAPEAGEAEDGAVKEQEKETVAADKPDVTAEGDAEIGSEVADSESSSEPDAASEDAGAEKSPDVLTPEVLPEVVSPDVLAETDAPPYPGCADGTVEQNYGPTMHGCNGAKTQCAAAELCTPGWHLCTVPEYIARGGDVTAATDLRWLAACIRENCSATHAPTGAVCQSCEPKTGGQAATAWTCSQMQADSDPNCWLGERSHPTKKLRIGALSAPCGMMDAQTTATALGAVCCS